MPVSRKNKNVKKNKNKSRSYKNSVNTSIMKGGHKGDIKNIIIIYIWKLT